MVKPSSFNLFDYADTENFTKVFDTGGVITVGDDIVLTHNVVGKLFNVVHKYFKTGELRCGLSPAGFFPLGRGFTLTCKKVHIVFTVDIAKASHCNEACFYL